jgi:bacteriorhodopsin
MKKEIKYAIYMIALGAALVAYADEKFASKDDVSQIKQDVRAIYKHLLGDNE